MRLQQIIYTVCVIALALPTFANAEIYKWKDKNGVTRYSDTPPPVSVRVDTLGKKNTARPALPETQASEAEVAKQSAASGSEGANHPVEFNDPPPDPKMEAMRLRAKNAEIEKEKKRVEAEQAKADAENCKVAKANYQTYSQGGRIYKINEKGERVYEDDAGLAAGKARAQAEIRKYCK